MPLQGAQCKASLVDMDNLRRIQHAHGTACNLYLVAASEPLKIVGLPSHISASSSRLLARLGIGWKLCKVVKPFGIIREECLFSEDARSFCSLGCDLQVGLRCCPFTGLSSIGNIAHLINECQVNLEN